jgi:hypothetical protein
MSSIKIGDKVLIHSKSTGCPLSDIFRRDGKRYPNSVPFYGYIRNEKIDRRGKKIYTIMYTQIGHGGDYYLQEDFELNEMFSDKDFEL